MSSVTESTVGQPIGAAIAVPAAAAVDEGKRRVVLGIVNLSHLLNHTQSSMTAVLYPVMMTELGLTLFHIGVLETIAQFAAQGAQILYGFLARFWPRSMLLGVANIFVGIFGFMTGLVQSYPQLALIRAAHGFGSSAQHPIGSAILVTYYQEARGRVLTLHHSAGNLGGLLAPVLVGVLLLVTDWRTVFYVLAIPSIVMGVAYFFLGDVVRMPAGSRKQRTRASMQEYLTCLKDRNVMLLSLVQMVGAAGRGTGINTAFLTTFFIMALGVDATTASILLTVQLLGGLFGPLLIGWLADRFHRKLVVQLTLILSTATTLWLIVHTEVSAALILNLVVYGSVVNARGSLTQAMVSDSVSLEQLDTAFSLYYFIGFISGPLWTLLMGWLISLYGFGIGFAVVSTSYLAGVLLIAFTNLQMPGPQKGTRSASAAG